MEERCMVCECTKNEHQIYQFELGCWCTRCIDYAMTNSRQWENVWYAAIEFCDSLKGHRGAILGGLSLEKLSTLKDALSEHYSKASRPDGT